MSRILIVLLLCTVLSVYGQWFFNPFQVQQASTAAPPAPYYVDHFKRQGYETDDKGSVWHGNDHAKIYLIARTSWP